MKYFLIAACLLFAGCTNLDRSNEVKYTRLTVTDPTGNFVAEWVAEGRVRKAGVAQGTFREAVEGYDILAVERRTGPPHSLRIRYPNRRAVTVVGPNIILEEIEKPDWLLALDAEGEAAKK